MTDTSVRISAAIRLVRAHRLEQLVRSQLGRHASQRFPKDLLAEACQRSVVSSDPFPSQPIHERDRRRHGQVRRVVVRSEVAERGREPFVVLPRRDQRSDAVAMVHPGIETGRAERRAAPLVEVARPEVGAQGAQVQFDHAGPVRPVHQHRHVAVPKLAGQLGHRKDQAGRRGDVVDDGEAGSAGHAREHRVEQISRAGGGPRNRLHGQHGPGASARSLGGEPHRSVGLLVDQDLIPALQFDDVQDRAHRRGRVRHEHEAVGVRVQELRGGAPRRVQTVVERAPEEAGWVRLHVSPDLVLGLLHQEGHGPERAVVQMGGAGVQRPQRADLGPVIAPQMVLHGRCGGASLELGGARPGDRLVHARER